MRGLYSSKTEIRHKIFTEIARMAYEGQSPETLEKGASCSFHVQPKAGLAQGDYSDTLVFGIEEDEATVAQAEAGVSVKAEEKPQVSLKADPSEIIYDPMEEGYNTPDYVYRITLTNTGNTAEGFNHYHWAPALETHLGEFKDCYHLKGRSLYLQGDLADILKELWTQL